MAFPNNTWIELHLCCMLPFLTMHRESEYHQAEYPVIEVFGSWGFCAISSANALLESQKSTTTCRGSTRSSVTRLFLS